MRNRAKCKLCKCVIESFHPTDTVTCQCGQIYVSGGASMQCGAEDFGNFILVDDNGKEHEVRTIEKDTEVGPPEISQPLNQPTKHELVDMLVQIVKVYEDLPDMAKQHPVTNYDMQSALSLILCILKSET
jgi:hypothetical protein